MKTIPFDFDLALWIIEGDYVGNIKTRNGRNVRILSFFLLNINQIVAAVEDGIDHEIVRQYNAEGIDADLNHNYDLVTELSIND